MTERIERLSKEGQELMRDVHPQVGEIKEQIETVKEAVSTEKN